MSITGIYDCISELGSTITSISVTFEQNNLTSASTDRLFTNCFNLSICITREAIYRDDYWDSSR